MSLEITRGQGFRVASHVAGQGLSWHHLTLLVDRAAETLAGLEPMLEALCAQAARRPMVPLHVKLYGEIGSCADVLEAWARALRTAGLEQDLPCTFIGNRPCVGGGLAGIQLIGLSGEGLSGRTLMKDDQPCGRLLQTDELSIALLADIVGTRNADVPAQMASMFARAIEGVEALGLQYRNVARTWIHVDPLLWYYDDLNRARTTAYTDLGLIPADAPPSVPASTGIQGAHPDGAACVMDVLALARKAGGSPLHRPMRTPHQCEAYAYGSSFARGTTIEGSGMRLLLASGTASIDTSGETVHLGDPAGQVRETYAAVSDLLQAQGAGLSQVVTGVAFCKDEQTHAAYRALLDAGQIPDLPVPLVYADICRDDLLFELEPTAVG